MFTGIVKGMAKVDKLINSNGMKKITIVFEPSQIKDLQVGASVAIDGVCLTATSISTNSVEFDIIRETLERTTLKNLKVGRKVNFERAAKLGDEIGGHLTSGHIYDTALIKNIDKTENNTILTLEGKKWMKYLFPKGYIAIDGVSLTVVDVNADTFTVHLIPETLRMTVLGSKTCGERVNIEIDSQIQAIVDTIERIDGRSELYNRPDDHLHTKTHV